MPFDSFMTAALAWELKREITDRKVDKICQPERDEIDLVFRFTNRNRLVINCTASTPYMALSAESRENPATPPMMCMLLRKHLSRAKITAVEQLGFDRIIRLTFDSGDEMGFRREKFLYCEMMGRGSNLIFADENNKILSAFRQNDITTKFGRVVMVGMPYEAMPPQDKIDPISCTFETFVSLFSSIPGSDRIDQVIQKRFSGFGKLTAREIAYLASGEPEGEVSSVSQEKIWKAFCNVLDRVRREEFDPCLIYESEEAYLSGESPLDFSFMPITHLAKEMFVTKCQSVSEAIETYYLVRNARERQKQHHNDIAQILKTCMNRLQKKIDAQTLQLDEAQDAEKMKKYGDLIMQELYRIRRGDESVDVTDYETMETIRIPLDKMMTPSQNAQRFYREYSKKKTAQTKVQEQIGIARKELEYAESVVATLENAVTSADIAQIREELSHWNYGRRLTTGLKKPQKKITRAKPYEGKTGGGFLFYIGMNNLQNDAVSTHLAENDDMWFHVKDYHGSHVLLKAERDRPFSDADLEEAASLAAYYSQCKESDRVQVDFTRAKFIKKPAGSRPGFVTYKNHQTALVRPQKMK